MKGFYLIIINLFLLPFSLSGQSANLERGLVAHLPFNGNTKDMGPHANHGISKGVDLATDKFGIANNCYSFNGIGDYIEVPNSKSINSINRQKSMSVSAWIYVKNWDHEDHEFISIHEKTSAEICKSIPSFYISKDRWAKFGEVLHTGDFPFVQWTHIVMIQGADYLQYYVNGRLVQDIEAFPYFKINQESLKIGATPCGKTHFFHGLMDDYRLYNRKLTVEEIMLLYKFKEEPPAVEEDNSAKAIVEGKPPKKPIKQAQRAKKINPKSPLPVISNKPIVEQVKTPMAVPDPPKEIKGRVVEFTRTIEVAQRALEIEIWDRKSQDGDKITVLINGDEPILENYKLLNKKKSIQLDLTKDSYFTLHAENLGMIPPNTAAFSINDGMTTQTIELSSDMGKSETILIKVLTE